MSNIFNKRTKGYTDPEQIKTQAKLDTAADFLDITDIHSNFLYTGSNLVVAFLEMTPVSLDLLSEQEINHMIRSLCSAFSRSKIPLQFFSISRPIDVTPSTSFLSSHIEKSSIGIRNKLIRQSIASMTERAVSGNDVERHFFMFFYEEITKTREMAEKSLTDHVRETKQNLAANSVKSEILPENKIIQLCNLIANPSYVAVESPTYTTAMPSLLNV